VDLTMAIRRSFTLLELVIVITMIGILLTLAIPKFNITKERAIAKEALANLKLVYAAEKIYRIENPNYYPSSGSKTDVVADINPNLQLSLTEVNWDYDITGGTDVFTATAARTSGPYSTCIYQITQTGGDPIVKSGTCP